MRAYEKPLREGCLKECGDQILVRNFEFLNFIVFLGAILSFVSG